MAQARLLQRPTSPWRFPGGLLVLGSFALLYTAASAAHMLLVKHTIGFNAYLGDGPGLPQHLLLTMQLTKAALLLGVLWLALRTRGLGWATLGFRPTTWGWILLAVLVAIAGLLLRLGLARWMAVAVPDWAVFMANPYGTPDGGLVVGIALGLCTVVLTPVAEEAFFRGFLFTWMTGHRPVWLAMLVSSLIFGAMHIIPPQAISAALMALALCALYWFSGSLWPPIVAHMVGNGLAYAAMVAGSQ
ncbi:MULTISPECIES: CPBP family intramembrane glutamic endopeptidase [unclassified Microbulbifer]|uniref:CPBP family intramembrane glutamic endopeptidase n=1 Tax=unclassified Microbulbifer TaxID=2619833 RepID=UPI001E55E919|nr:CPBP family intramembrane glutamic endopeptidase [Microbulbifer sp. YPW16]UHQ54954.1 CPBP family intramembrane metalloprotease [Microbulbifer sp. YPW16]